MFLKSKFHAQIEDGIKGITINNQQHRKHNFEQFVTML